MKIIKYLIILKAFSSVVFAGINNYTYLDKIDEWIIERKIGKKFEEIRCRAYLPGYGTWFSERIHIDKEDNIVIPPELLSNIDESKLDTRKVKIALSRCRNDFFY
tara:strand:- start:55 stop:369 length:315 start_codon:yes stop_codon:yes gene_type:complete